MATNTTPQIATTWPLRLSLRRGLVSGGLGSEDILSDIPAQAHEGHDEDQNHEQHQPQREREIAAPPRTGLRLSFAGRIAHAKSPQACRSRGFSLIRCSTSRVANSRVR